MCLGSSPSGDVHIPFKDLLPMVDPNNIIFDGKCSRTFKFNDGMLAIRGSYWLILIAQKHLTVNNQEYYFV